MTTNFLQFNPTKNNMLSDFLWSVNVFRTQGATKGKASSSGFNKFAYQASTMVAALAQMMEQKGAGTAEPSDEYDMSDSNIITLKNNLANLMTRADMADYVLATALNSYIAKSAVTKITAGYAMTETDFYKTIQLQTATTTVLVTPPASAVDGAWVKLKNACTDPNGKLQFNALVDGETLTLENNEEVVVYFDGTAYHGKKISDGSGMPSPGEANEKMFTNDAGTGVEWDKGFDLELFSKNMEDSGSTVNYTNCSFRPSVVIVFAYASGMLSSGTCLSIGVSNFINQFTAAMSTYYSDEEIPGGNYNNDAVAVLGGASQNQIGKVAAALANGVSITWAKTGSPSGTIMGAILYLR